MYCGSALPFPYIIWIEWIDRIDWPRLFAPVLSDYCAELHWVAIPSQRAMSQLLSLCLPRRLQHWAADALAYSTAAPRTLRFSASWLVFVFSPSIFLPSLSPFCISIQRHPSAKYGSTFSGYPHGTVSALWTKEHWLLQLPAAERRRLETTQWDCAHLSPYEMPLLPECFTEYSTNKAAASRVPIRTLTLHGVN